MNRDKWRSNRIIRTIIFRCRSFMEKRSFSRGRNNKILNKGVRVTSRIQIDGEDNVVFCENRSVLYNCLVKIKGRGNRIILREGAYLSGVELFVQDNECTIEIGKNTFVGHHTHLACTEDGSILQIGDNCMLSSYVQLRTGDRHSILNADGNRINQASNVIIGNHCWLGEGCKVLKGVSLGEDVIVSTGAIVTKSYDSNVLLGGVPAKILKQGVNWDANRL